MRKVCEKQWKKSEEREIFRAIAERREQSTPSRVTPDWVAAFRKSVMA